MKQTYKRVIGGKLYNTEVAEALLRVEVTYNNVMKPNPLTLYRSKKGNFFTVEEFLSVGASNAAVHHVEFKVLSHNEAREWVEKWANEDYDKVFGAPEEA